MGSASHFLTTRCTCRLMRGDERHNFKNEAIANPAALQRLFQLDMLLAAHWARVKRFSYRQPFNSGSKTKPGKKKSYTVQINVARPCNYAVLIGFLSCLHFNLWWCHQPKCICAFTAKQPATFSYHLFWRSKWIGACLPITWPNQKAGVRTWSVIFFFLSFCVLWQHTFVFSGAPKRPVHNHYHCLSPPACPPNNICNHVCTGAPSDSPPLPPAFVYNGVLKAVTNDACSLLSAHNADVAFFGPHRHFLTISALEWVRGGNIWCVTHGSVRTYMLQKWLK